MPSANTVDALVIRDAVVTAINGQAFAPIATATPVYDAIFKLEKLQSFNGGQLIVMPQSRIADPGSRGGPRRWTIKIGVAIQYKVSKTPAPATEVDPYIAEACTIADYFERLTPNTFPAVGAGGIVIPANCVKVEHPHLFLEEHLNVFGVLTSLITLTFLVN
ncbi:MAG TPA: hypothetical protein VHY37_07145 [Tepidisphaeraceae bacterium]|jgi:hypothetical protein|nr:hypothetical protein [Tepidisphaeraceae bacterium]